MFVYFQTIENQIFDTYDQLCCWNNNWFVTILQTILKIVNLNIYFSAPNGCTPTIFVGYFNFFMCTFDVQTWQLGFSEIIS